MEALKLFSEFAISGVIVSTIIQYTKGWLGTKTNRVIWSLLISFVIGILIYGLNFVPVSWWQMIVGVFAAANTVYAVFFNKGSQQ